MGSQPRLTDPASRSRSYHAIIAHARARDMNHLLISRQFLSEKKEIYAHFTDRAKCVFLKLCFANDLVKRG